MDYEDQIEEIFHYFDFYKVRCVMLALDWKWAFESNLRIPNVEDMKNMAKRLLKDVSGSEGTMECGGFRAQCRNGELSLSFVVESWFVEKEV